MSTLPPDAAPEIELEILKLNGDNIARDWHNVRFAFIKSHHLWRQYPETKVPKLFNEIAGKYKLV
jgi:hypothetical protein